MIVKRLLELSKQQLFRFVVRTKLQYREVLPRKCPEGGKLKCQLLVPKACRQKLLRLVH